MNKYLVIANDGYTTDNNGDETNNAQMLGRITAQSKLEAIEKFWETYPDQTEGFDISDALAIQLHESEWA